MEVFFITAIVEQKEKNKTYILLLVMRIAAFCSHKYHHQSMPQELCN